ncbi:MAG: MarR family transcriptional regulator [Chloroflexi bacterium]|nr:MarR family transcriptional regulator [Chloroflexota bacterium]
MLTGNGETPPSSHDRSTLVGDILAQLDLIMRNLKHRFHKSGDVEIFDLSMAQFRAICCLEERPVNMSKLAESLGVSLPSTTGVIDRLVERGLVSRHEDPEDRRLVVCELTSKGQEVAASFYEADHAITEAMLASLSLEDLRVVHQAFLLMSQGAAQLREAMAQETATVAGQPLRRAP